MRLSFKSLATIGALLLFSSTPAMAQHAGQGGGGHSGGGHAGSGGAHVAAPRKHSSSHPTGDIATRRVTPPHPPVTTHTTAVAPVHLPHSSYGRYSSLSDRDRRGRAHARLRILGAPRNAGVIVDGQYVGVVDDFDGVFQHLELLPGIHHVEIRTPGFEAILFDVTTQGSRTITYRVQMPRLQP